MKSFEEFKVKDFTFRVKKMNAIELLALRSQISFNSFADTQNCYNEILMKTEVKIKNDDWQQVKQGNDFYPAGAEDDVELIEEIINNVLEQLKRVFQKSNASKSTTE